MRNVLRVLIIAGTLIFSLTCGLLLVRFLIPFYFKLFSPIPETLQNFYIAIAVFSLLVMVLEIIFFRKGKYNWGIWLLGSSILLLGFGIPIFILENNNMLWHEAVFHKPGPVYFIEISDKGIAVLKHFQNLYNLIWDKVYLFAYSYTVIYLAGYFYLRKTDGRVGGVRIKL